MNKDFNTHNNSEVDANMTSLQGYLDINYESLVEVFGEPIVGEGDKSDWEWEIERNGTVATIYNWKNGPVWGGPYRSGTEVKTWHVGGHTKEAVELVKSLLIMGGVLA